MHRCLYILTIFLPAILGCSKDTIMRPYALVAVKFVGDEDYIGKEKVEGNWDITTHIVSLHAEGYQFQIFDLYLPAVIAIGKYGPITIHNISLSDGLDFRPIRLAEGEINISLLDSTLIQGDFTASLQDEFNGAEERSIKGFFEIHQ